MGFRQYETTVLAGLRISELPLAILTLSVVLAYEVNFGYEAYCLSNKTYTQSESHTLRFPFKEETVWYPSDLCIANSPKVRFQFNTDHSPEAIAFLVVSAVTVFHFLVSLIICFLLWSHVIRPRHSRNLLTLDFVIQIILTLAWLASAIAWLIGSIQFVNEIGEESMIMKSRSLKPCNNRCSGRPALDNLGCCTLNYSGPVAIIYAAPIVGLILFIVSLIEVILLLKKTRFAEGVFKQINSPNHQPFDRSNPVWTTPSGKKIYGYNG